MIREEIKAKHLEITRVDQRYFTIVVTTEKPTTSRRSVSTKVRKAYSYRTLNELIADVRSFLRD